MTVSSHWLVKQEPESYAFARLVADRRTEWDGVRNYQARNNLQAMKRGDLVLYYHSGGEKAIVGIAKVAAAAHPDSTSDDPRWVSVDLAPVKALAEPVPLALVKEDSVLAGLPLVTQSRLSVMPVTAAQFRRVLKLGRTSP
jgi:predicted RNA-binding protein with PUA-like domain